MTTPAEQLAALAARLSASLAAEAKARPSVRVRLARPLETSAPGAGAPANGAKATVASILGPIGDAYPGGREPKAPWAPVMEAFRAQVAECQRCALGGRRKNLVFGDGDPKAELVFVGDAPGADEDASGQALAGAAGGMLDRMVAAMGYKRGQVYVLNVVKCRPPANKPPEPAEIAACRPYLEHQLALIQPKVICAMGETAAQQLLGVAEPLGKLRGQWGQYHGTPVMPTYAPAAMLRDPGLKRHVWDDMKLVMQKLKPA